MIVRFIQSWWWLGPACPYLSTMCNHSRITPIIFIYFLWPLSCNPVLCFEPSVSKLPLSTSQLQEMCAQINRGFNHSFTNFVPQSSILHIFHLPHLQILYCAACAHMLSYYHFCWPIKPARQGNVNVSGSRSHGGCCQPVATHKTHHTHDQYPLAWVQCKGHWGSTVCTVH